jgi:hypothetical protein
VTLIREDDPRVVEVVERIRALKRLAISERMQTHKAQTALFHQVPEDILAAVTLVLARNEKNRGDHNATPRSK